MANVMRMRRTTAGPPTARAPMARAKVEGFDPKKAKQPLEIGSQAVWSVSSSKPGYGVSHLRDGSTETYWQSDGVQPHSINIEFMKKTAVKQVAILVDYKLDESYTPKKIGIRAGSHFHDLHQLSTHELDEPQNWVRFNVVDKDERPVRAFLFQIVIYSNHQNGRDTHIRQAAIFEPDLKPSDQANMNLAGPVVVEFESPEFRSMQICR